MTKDDIINIITNNIYANSVGLITGPVLQQVLLHMVDFAGGDSFWQEDENGNIYTVKNAYSTGELSAYGLGPDSTPGVGGTTVAWGGIEDDAIELTVDGITHEILLSSFSGGSGGPSGPIDWAAIENKPSTFAPSAHTHAWSDLTGTPTTLSGYGITNAYTKPEVDNHINNADVHLTSTERQILSYFSIDNGKVKVSADFYSTGEISAYGAGSGSGGSGGSNVVWGTTTNNYSPLTVEGSTKTVALSGHTHAWGDVTGKPSTFAPSAHTHAWGDVTGKPTTLSGYGITDVYTKTEVTNLIASHANNEGAAKHLTQAQLTGLTNLLTWWKLDVNGLLYTELSVYSQGEVSAFGAGSGGSGGSSVSWGTTANNYSPLTVEGSTKTVALSGHTHTIADISNLQPSLNAKQNTLTAGTGIDITNNVISATGGSGGSNVSWGTESSNYVPLTVEGAAKTVALSGHTHAWGDVTGKPSTFAPSAHTHAWGDVTGKPSTFTPSSHTHAAGDITSGTFAIARIPTGTTSSTVSLGNHTHTWASITSKPSTFTPSSHTHAAGDITSGTFAIARIPTGTTSSTVSLGNHTHTFASLTSRPTTLSGYGITDAVPSNRTVTAGNGMTGGGALSANITLTLATPGTLTGSTANSVTASSHTHSITTTTVGASNTIVQTDSNGAVRGARLLVGADWSLELSGTELQIKRSGVITQRFLADGSIVGLGEVTAYGAGTGGDGVALLRSGGTMTGNLVMGGTASIGAAGSPLRLLGSTLTFGGSTVLTAANTSAGITTNKITMGNGWTIEQTSASLTIRRNGVIKGTFNA